MFENRIILAALCLFLFALKQCHAANSTDSSLELVHVIFRHGDRTNDERTIYPNDPYINETYYPTGVGELTLEGKRTMYNKVGKQLRLRYDTFLGDVYSPDLLEARSTDSRRTKASLLLVLAALFPPSKTQVWQDGFNWQPIPTTYLPFKEDKEFFGILSEESVPLLMTYLQSPEYERKMSKYENLLGYVQKHTGWTMNDMSLFSFTYFCLTTEEELGLQLPEWTKPIYPQPLESLAEIAYYDYVANDAITKQSGGHMLKKILKDAHAKINGHKIKMHLLSGHEINCATMLLLLGMFKPHVPSYGAHIIFELHKIDGVYGFKIFYQDHKQKEPKLMRIPKVGDFCPLTKFEEIYKNYLP